MRVPGVRWILVARRKNRLFADATGVLILNVATVCVNFAAVLVLARILGAREFGAYSFAIAWAILLAVPALLGLPPLVMRTVASAHVQSDWGRMRGMLRRANQASVATSSATIAVAAALGWLLLREDDSLFGPYLVALALIPIAGLTSIRQAAMLGIGWVVVGRMPETLIWPALFLVTVVSADAVKDGGLDALDVVTIHVVTAAITLFLGTLLLRRSLPAETRRAETTYETAAWLRSGFSIVLATGIIVLNDKVGVILVGLIRGPTDAGIYTVAFRAATVITFLFTTARYAVAPAVARLHALEEREELQSTVTRAARTVFILTLPLALGLVIFADDVLRLFGPEFEGAVSALRILCFGQLTVVVIGYAAAVLLMTGNEKYMRRPVAAGVLVNVALSLALISVWGADGAAAATAVGVVIASIGLALVSWKRVGIYSPAIGLSKAAR